MAELPMKPNSTSPNELSRREFLKSSTAVALAGPALAQGAFAQARNSSPGETLRIALIGCGGRGTGAAAPAPTADPNMKLVAVGDAFKERVQAHPPKLLKQNRNCQKKE